ncbi:MAG TPA: hypothetical protein VMR76_01285 [Candidatus Saccharimonadia bacterium]|nr:hypothetical protein [Candidatus Saccharimonadia bacterium]
MAETTQPTADKDKKFRLASRDKLNIKIYSPFKIYFDGLADSLTAKNETGVFDILPMHHKFITLLEPGNVTINSSHGIQKIAIDKALLHVTNNVVTVFLDV